MPSVHLDGCQLLRISLTTSTSSVGPLPFSQSVSSAFIRGPFLPSPRPRLGQNRLHNLHLIRRTDEPFVEAVVEKGERFRVEAEEIEQRGVEVFDVDGVFGGAE